ncbi:MAG: putative IIA-like nitrogen-regulatory protein PtsN [Pelosinus sp.]|jgi:PTS system ascorbate-specific IIA component|nr:putative IIA-like nitrogen-regulatory protein PtsN [Pelosinus sp.]
MFKDLIEKKRVGFAEGFDCWEDAVRAAAQPLLRDKAIAECYVDAMIECIKKFGPYIVIAPDVAMPHAQGVNGVKETSISFMKVDRPVRFGESKEHDARLIFVLASVDNDSHLDMLQALVAAISDEDILAQLPTITCIGDLQKILLQK